MAPQLVVANAPYKKYPGGLIALRATDWLGPSRSSLTIETDSRAINGQVVRDTQKVTTTIFSNASGAFAEADDTLIIDLSIVPVETIMWYWIGLSVLIVGDWDPSNVNTLKGSGTDHFGWATESAYYGAVNSPTEADYMSIFKKPWHRTHYSIMYFAIQARIVTGNEILHIRTYAQNNTTIEWLLDQIFLIPRLYFNAGNPEWLPLDFADFGGDQGLFNFPSPVDGSDGGDNNGKFTNHLTSTEVNSDFSGLDSGGGDYQRKSAYSGAEYFAQMTEEDFLQLYNTTTTPDSEPKSSHLYGIHGVNYRPQETFLNDTFSRTVAPGNKSWGNSPEGFIYRWNGGITSMDAYVDGSQGIIEGISTTGALVMNLTDRIFTPATGLGAAIIEHSMSFSGIFKADEASSIDPDFFYAVGIILNCSGSSIQRSWSLTVDLDNKLWGIWLMNSHSGIADPSQPDSGAQYKIAGTYDISSWFAWNSPVGFRLQRDRYRIRAKIWDATGSEPSAWDFDGFLPTTTNNSGSLGAGSPPANVRAYPYSDDFQTAHNTVIQTTISPAAGMVWVDNNSAKTYWDNFKVEYLPDGDAASMYVAVERPNGQKIGEIEIPYGAHHMVYWGQRDWTDFDIPFGASLVEFSARNWNALSAAKLQRADTSYWWMRSLHGGPIDLSKIRFRSYETGDI